MTHDLVGFGLLALAACNAYFDWAYQFRRSFYSEQDWKARNYLDGPVFRFADRWFMSAFLAFIGLGILLARQ